MPIVEHTVALNSEQDFGKRVPPGALGEVLREMPKAVERSIRMGFVGRSQRKGRKAPWFEAAADIRYLGYSPGEKLELHFEAPSFAHAAPELYRQQELWSTKPDAEDTGFDLLCDVVSEVQKGNKDSDSFDSSLLKELTSFRHSLKGPFQGIEIAGHRYEQTAPAIVDQALITRAGELISSTPIPQQIRLVGTLDMIRASTNSFELLLDEGQRIPAVLENSEIATVTELLNHRVLVLGKSIFRPSGRLLRIDATQIQAGVDEPSFWSRVPTPGSGKLDLSDLRKPQGPRSGLAAIIGKWPGGESDEEILQELEELS